ncbi:MAG: hypothetical protein AB7T49_04620 [Oligoflexales bacterium]
MNKNIGLTLLSALLLIGCKPPAPNPEIQRKPRNTGDLDKDKDKNKPLDPFTPAKDQVWTKVIENAEKDFSSEVSSEGNAFSATLDLTSTLYKGQIPSNQVNTKSYQVAYTYGQTPPQHQVGGNSTPCISGRSFRLFCNALANNPTQEFDVSADSVKVFITPPSASETATKSFALDAGQKTVTFEPSVLPSIGTKVRIVFVPKEVQMNIGKNLVASTVSVAISNVTIPRERYSVTNGVVSVLVPGVEPFALSMTYDLKVPGRVINIPTGATNIKLVDDASGTAIGFKEYADRIVINDNEYVEGKKVRVSYTKPQGASNIEIPLQHTPLKDTLKVEVPGVSNCSIGSGITIDGQKIVVACNTSGVAKVEIKYSYKYSDSVSFPIDVANPELGEWTVEANGQPVKFQREGSVIKLEDALPNGTELTIKFSRAV